ncbi:MAG: DUF4269 domain-containing protein [Cyanobacteriota bacterium]|nr:DUF4269 domain-containing protein [Cyanobacteriota bacterium]
MSKDWRDISYLKTGNPRQRRVYDLLQEHRILEELQDFDRAVVSTICVGFDIPTSDIDIICCAPNLCELETVLRECYGQHECFSLRYRPPKGDSLVCSFWLEEFEIEIFGSLEPIECQHAYRHLGVMDRLAFLGGISLQEDIRQLKKSGLKTEPAIAKYLQLPGNPYEAVLALERVGDRNLLELIQRNARSAHF